ncbi:MAG: PTS fructose transporter subunit IIC [Microbacteriaceae bacterium]
MNTVSAGARLRQYLMTGVSYMIPLVAAGGILIALGFMLGGYHAYDAAEMNFTSGAFNFLDIKNWAFVIFWLGKAAFAFFVPVLAAFIAYAIADRPGIAPGFVAGAVAVGTDGNPLGTGAGFLGAIAGGLLAGYVAKWISGWSVPSWFRPVMPVIVIPVLASVVVGFVMVLLLGGPIKALNDGLTGWLGGFDQSQLAVLGIVLGLMMAFDMGGPVNKVAYVFATTGLANAGDSVSSTPAIIMAAVMAAGMVPPIAMALATVLRKSLFSESEVENGKAAWLLGASFISEGAIPFAAADPLRVIPSIMVGSAVTGAISAALGAGSLAPHGGIWVLPMIGNPLAFFGAIVIGSVVAALLVIVLKGMGAKK